MQIPDATANLRALMMLIHDLVVRALDSGDAEPPGGLELVMDGCALSALLTEHELCLEEACVLGLALLPHLSPRYFRGLLQDCADAPAIPLLEETLHGQGGWLIPSGETAAFLLAGEDLDARLALQTLFGPEHWFARQGVLHLEDPDPGAPILSGRLAMDPDWIRRLTTGQAARPAFGPKFPAQRVTTALDWSDLVLPRTTREQIDELDAWQRHRGTLLDNWGMRARLRPGYRALFHGPSGTGKTLTATLLGKALNRDVYRVDLSTVVSKYIGETEKNLARLFAQAEKLDAILFFDEADALFGKRTAVKDAHDRYANQEVSFLLQRVEDYDGLVILATNFRANMDDAFLRRFNAIIGFPMPGPEERRRIWEGCLPDRGDRADIAARMAVFELSGGSILNVAQHAALLAVTAGRDAPDLRDALRGVRREVEKDGKVFRNLLTDVALDDT